jgi:hypothetical protein
MTTPSTLRYAWFVDQSPGRGIIPAPVLTVPSGGGTKFYFEAKIVSFFQGGSVCIGIGSEQFALGGPNQTNSLDVSVAGPHAQAANSIIVQNGGNSGAGVWNGWSYPANGPNGMPQNTEQTSDWIGVAVDTFARRFWVRDVTVNSAVWYGNASGTQDPAAGTGGWDYGVGSTHAGMTGTKLYIIGGIGYSAFYNVHGSMLLNTGFTAFAAAVPTDYVAWDSTGGTTFNPSDAATEITFSGGNLQITSTAISGAGNDELVHFVRSTSFKTLL